MTWSTLTPSAPITRVQDRKGSLALISAAPNEVLRRKELAWKRSLLRYRQPSCCGSLGYCCASYVAADRKARAPVETGRGPQRGNALHIVAPRRSRLRSAVNSCGAVKATA